MTTQFMDGIELLSSIEILSYSMGAIILFFFFGVGVVSIGLAALEDYTNCGLALTLVGAIFIGIMIICLCNPQPTGEYQYKVTITDEVNFNDFNEKYKIVDQDGKIYTIEIKE